MRMVIVFVLIVVLSVVNLTNHLELYMLKKIRKTTMKIICCAIVIVICIALVACDKEEPQNNTTTVVKKSLIQQRNEVYEAEGKIKWYDYEGKGYSFGKLDMATTFIDPHHRHYKWEDLTSYEMEFCDKEQKTSLLNSAGDAVKNFWRETSEDVSVAVFSNAVISFVELTAEIIENENSANQKYYDRQIDILQLAIENDGDISDAEIEEILKVFDVYQPQKKHSGKSIDYFENDAIEVSQKLYVPMISSGDGLWKSVFEQQDSSNKTSIPYIIEDSSGIHNKNEKAVVEGLSGGIILENEIISKETEQIFCIRLILIYSGEYYSLLCDHVKELVGEDRIEECMKFATPAVNVIKPVIDEVVNGYLLEEFGVQL